MTVDDYGRETAVVARDGYVHEDGGEGVRHYLTESTGLSPTNRYGEFIA